ncbi:hypothetical protein BCR43DRAFT_487626 [Syncephalastrum racemosum]|uniref:Uncharacterized protein n=1 Tax=Syncephalastrum racemosum TaxID=13706 RepID=A0A1X2HHI9_SYNRA|nr:hypothetical protein BCR43DRAFT_487626 [Syncephalastrum racemosum]
MYYVVFACPSRCFRWLSWDSFKCGIRGCPTGWTGECPSPRDGARATDYHFGGRTAKRHSIFYLKNDSIFTTFLSDMSQLMYSCHV